MQRAIVARRASQVLGALALVVTVGSVAPASAEEWRREGWRDHERREEWRESREREREWREREWRERGEYHPYAVPPPAVVYAPPVEGPALNFVFPLNLR